jgi:hypothetical protein
MKVKFAFPAVWEIACCIIEEESHGFKPPNTVFMPYQTPQQHHYPIIMP